MLGLRCFGFDESKLRLDVNLDPLTQLRILSKQISNVLAALTESFGLIREPCTALLNYVLSDRKVDQVTFARNAFTIHNVEFAFPEWRSTFVLNNLYTRPVADNPVAVFNGTDTPNIQPKARVKFQCLAARCGFRVREIPVTRAYPNTGVVPTKIKGWRGNWHILMTLLRACGGLYNPSRSGVYSPLLPGKEGCGWPMR